MYIFIFCHFTGLRQGITSARRGQRILQIEIKKYLFLSLFDVMAINGKPQVVPPEIQMFNCSLLMFCLLLSVYVCGTARLLSQSGPVILTCHHLD